ncbi:MAG: RNA polymerase sigma factor [Acidobacteria bacterium]|nr:RNA polymerase sigma factor [Acidobacteriota bacterium]
MLRVREGDSSSFALLLSRHRAPVVNFLFRMVQNQAVAEELAQEVFLRVYRARQTYEVSAKFTTWLFRIASRLALNWLRDTRKEKAQASLDREVADGVAWEVADRAPTVEHTLVKEARMAEIRRAIARLPEKQRAAVLMHKYQEMGYAQIAGVLGCSEPAIKSLLFRAYETLRGRLSHMG